MLKRLCDICGREIRKDEVYHTIDIKNTVEGDHLYGMLYTDVCMNCKCDAMEAVDKLRKEAQP